MTVSHNPSHLKALLKKNRIIWRRGGFRSWLQVILPVAFAAIMLSLRNTSPIKDIPETTYYNQPDWLFSYDGTLSTADTPYLSACTDSFGSSVIGLSPAPANDPIISQLNTIFASLGLQTKSFTGIDEINTYTSRSDYTTSSDLPLCFAVIMNTNSNGKYEYSLMFNVTDTSNDDIPQTSLPRIKDLAREDLDALNGYGRSGFLAVQNLIDNLILQAETGVSTATIQADVTSITVPAYRQDDLATALQGQSRVYLDIPLLVPYLSMIRGIVNEKEKRIREGMKIMGLRNSSFYLSWLITYFLIFTLISLLVTIILTHGLFKLSSFGFVFLWHWEFTMCLLALGFFVSTFTNKAKAASLVGFIINILLGMFQYIVSSNGTSRSAYIASSIAPQTSLTLGADHILDLEAAQLGLNAHTATLEVENYQMTFHYIIMALDIIVLLLAAWYLDQVLPSEFGIRKHPLFCLMRKKKKNDKVRISQSLDEHNTIIDQSENPENFEEVEATLKIQDESNESVMVQNLRKVYASKKVAVDGVSFSMYNNQIFALLGHNGAGKTTTISMITGLFGSTQGTTKVFGMDNQTQIDNIRKIMGVCPQHDILFDDMTVKEHLELFAVFKGVDPKIIPDEVEKTIEDIGLADKRDYLSKNLSGGQKRKLSIGIAFIGGSRFIILDEPSSGMDTSARRKLWEMLKNYKHNRVILLTTHFMDEADYLGDRIGIMGEGKLKCLGRPLFLKSRFGAGYNLTLVKKDINDPSKPIKELVLSHVEGGKVSSDISAEISFQLPLEAAPKFEKLFEDLDTNLEKLRISSYGLSETTLEEVFLNVAKVTAHNTPKEEQQAKSNQDPELDMYEPRRDCITNKWELFRTQFAALVMKRVHNMKRDKRSLVFEIFLPIILVIIGILLNKIDFSKVGDPLPLTDNLYGYQFQVDYNTFVPSGGASIYQNFIGKLQTTNAFNLVPYSPTDIGQFNLDVYNDQGQDIINSPVNVFSFYTNSFDTGTNQYQYTAFINSRAQEGSAFAMNKLNNAILKLATGDDQKEITVVVTPFQKTQGEKNIDQIYEGITLAFVFVIGMSFIPGSLIIYIVREREVNAKHQQIVSGVSLAAYWFSNYFVDIIKYLIPAIVNSLLASAFNATALIEGQKLAGLWTIFILYGFAIVSFVYLLSFLFKDYGKAQLASFFINFIAGFVGATVIGILRLFTSTMHVAKALQWVLRVLPTFSMAYGFLELADREAYASVEGLSEPMGVFSIDLILGDIIYMVVGAIVYLALVFVVEKLKNKQSLAVTLSRENGLAYVPQELDDDVQREEQEVAQSDNHTYSIKVDKLRKVYRLGRNNYKAAVERVSFGVKNGECFGLLGVNGAGKTTTFKILSGDIIQSSGKAYINGYSIPSEMEEARKDIGYCPQFDALLENLTGKEHLQLYAAIKGIPVHLRERLVEKHLQEMNLKQYENVPAGTYSGGNKRKLSVAIAIIGNPSVVFLDEPSTGMDPEARRAMWNVISRISRERKQSSVILTTHSMEEAEALSTKMGIMVSGSLKCLGTSQHIKSKFGGGYEIEVKLNIPTQEQVVESVKKLDMSGNQSINGQEAGEILDKLGLANLRNEISENGTGSAIHTELKKGKTSVGFVVEWALSEANGGKLKSFLMENFGNITLLEQFQSFFRFKTPSKFSIGRFFGTLEANKTNLNILQYSIRQSTIEQIFNNFANEKVQVQVQNEAPAEVKIDIEQREQRIGSSHQDEAKLH